ncbi:unnamed protein product [Lampetra planeri]
MFRLIGKLKENSHDDEIEQLDTTTRHASSGQDPGTTASERRLKDATKTRGRRSARERDLPSEASEEEAEAPREDEGAVGVRAVLVPNASGGNERLSLGRTRAVVCQRGKEEGKEQPKYRGLSSRG